jgi:hypothetical protein
VVRHVHVGRIDVRLVAVWFFYVTAA